MFRENQTHNVIRSALLPILMVAGACNRSPQDSPQVAEAAVEDPVVAVEQRLHEVEIDLDQVRRIAAIREGQLQHVVDDFFARYPLDQLPESMQEHLGNLGVGPGRVDEGADLKAFLSMITVFAFLDKYPYSSLPPGLSKELGRLGVDAADPASFGQVDLVEFAGLTGGFTWDSHQRQVQVQSLANRRGEEVSRLHHEKNQLDQQVQLSQAEVRRLGQEMVGVEMALDKEKAVHAQTRRTRDRTIKKLSELEALSARQRRQDETKIHHLESAKERVERALELERRGSYYDRAAEAAAQVLNRYQQAMIDMDRYYQRRRLLVADFSYRINDDGSVTGLQDRTGFQTHPVWVREKPGEVEEDYFKQLWKTFRQEVKLALKTTVKARKKSSYPAAQDLSQDLEDLLRRIPEKLWIQVKTPSGGRYRLDLSPQLEPLIRSLDEWRSL